jgi:hypothetical protein
MLIALRFPRRDLKYRASPLDGLLLATELSLA